jgi:hypothetical protein
MTPKWLSFAGWSSMVCACTDEGVRRHDLDGLEVVERLDEAICAGTFGFFERRLKLLERETGLRRDPQGLVFHWVYQRDEIAAHCVQPAGACAYGREFYGPLISFSHELVHAHLYRLGQPRVWLVEGMAVMLDDDFRAEPDPTVTPASMLVLEDARGLDYSSAGAFTAYLRDRYGMAALLDYYEATAGADIDDSVATFREVFDDDFLAVEADYLATFPRVAVGMLDCDVPEIERVGDTWSHTFDLVCDETTSIGPQEWIDDPERSLVWSGVAWNAAAGWYSFDLAASAEAYITIQACDNPEAVYVWTDEPQTDAYLAGGRYLVSGEAYIDTSPTATIAVRPRSGPPDASPVRQLPPRARLRRLAGEH